MIRAVFFDVDCTLYSHTLNEIPDSSAVALKKLREKGILIFLATGRHMLEIEQIDKKGIIFDGYITLSGQLCLNRDQQVVYQKALSGRDVSYLQSVFEQRRIPLVFVEEHEMYMNVYNEQVKSVHEMLHLQLPKIKPVSGNTIYQATLFDDREKVMEVASHLLDSKCTGWNSFGADIIPCTGGKAEGIRAMMREYGFEQDETMAFGDGENDIDMLSFAHISVAMGNGNEHLKQIADHVTDGVDDDGICKALRHYRLI